MDKFKFIYDKGSLLTITDVGGITIFIVSNDGFILFLDESKKETIIKALDELGYILSTSLKYRIQTEHKITIIPDKIKLKKFPTLLHFILFLIISSVFCYFEVFLFKTPFWINCIMGVSTFIILSNIFNGDKS